MTADGDIVLADGLDQLSPELREDVLANFCQSHAFRESAPTGLSTNLSERRLNDRVTKLCG